MRLQYRVQYRLTYNKYFSTQAGDYLTAFTSSQTEPQHNLTSPQKEASYDEFVDHVKELNQEMKCTVVEISQLKDRISSIELEIKTLKLFPWFPLTNAIMIRALFEVRHN